MELEALMSEWCATRTQAEVVAELAAADAAVGPVMDMADIGADPHIAARGTIVARRRHTDAGADRPPQRDAGDPALARSPARRRRRRHPRQRLDHLPTDPVRISAIP